MRIVLLMFILLSGTKSQLDYEKFIDRFPKEKADRNGNYLTRHLNMKNYADLLDEYPIVSEKNSFTYLCDGDSSKFFYEYDLYHMEDEYFIGHFKENFVHHAIARFEKTDYDLVIYSKYGRENYYHYLRSFNRNGDKVDELLVNEVNFGNSSNFYSYSYKYTLLSDDSLRVYSYMDNSRFAGVENDSLPKTKVVTEKYTIDSVGRFHFATKDSTLLENDLSGYNNFDVQPNADDPIAKYWTQ